MRIVFAGQQSNSIRMFRRQSLQTGNRSVRGPIVNDDNLVIRVIHPKQRRQAFLGVRIAVPIDDADEGSASFALGGRHAARGTCVYQVRLSQPFAVAIEFVRSRVLR